MFTQGIDEREAATKPITSSEVTRVIRTSCEVTFSFHRSNTRPNIAIPPVPNGPLLSHNQSLLGLYAIGIIQLWPS